MISILNVSKQFGTYADTCILLGLARLAYVAQLQIHRAKEITLADLSTTYQIQLKQALEPDEIVEQLQYKDLLQPVRGDKTKAIAGLDWSEIDFFNTKENTEIRNRYREFIRQSKLEKLELSDEDTPSQPDPRTQNGVILTYMRHDRKHNALWKAGWDIQQHFGALVASTLKAFADGDEASRGDQINRAAVYFKAYTGENLPATVSAVQIFLPTFVQGVNRSKADTNKIDGSIQKDWLLLWLIAIGLFEFGIAERIKVADNSFDWRMVMLEPKHIRLFDYREVLDQVRKFNPPSGAHGVARFDAEMSIGLSKELLKHHPAKDMGAPVQRRSRSPSIKEMVSGFSGTHFGSKGQVYGVKEIFSLGLPDWIRPETAEEVKNYQKLLDEHLAVVRSLSIDEGNSELLSAYRDFITGNDLSHFFRFHLSYADYIVRQLADLKAYAPRRFSQEGLDIMTQSFSKSDQDWSITEITQNKGFQRIARAINSATVYAGKIKTKQGVVELDWQRTYGLAQRLGNHAGSKKDFIAELTAFLASYENENLRIQEQLQKEGKPLRRVWVTNEDLEDFLKLLDDKRFNCNLVANLLLAYGYARWKKPLKEEAKDIPIVEDDDPSEDSKDNE